MAKTASAAVAAGTLVPTIALRHDGARACCVAGIVYTAGEGGIFRVPPEAVAPLLAHGFAPVAAVVRS
jgi:hypothetical protein